MLPGLHTSRQRLQVSDAPLVLTCLFAAIKIAERSCLTSYVCRSLCTGQEQTIDKPGIGVLSSIKDAYMHLCTMHETAAIKLELPRVLLLQCMTKATGEKYWKEKKNYTVRRHNGSL